MKLAEALMIRADLQKRIAQLGERLSMNAKVQEGDMPSENPEALLKELSENMIQLENLVTRINLTNCHEIPGVGTITALISKRDALTKKLSILREFLLSAAAKVDRYSKNEIRVMSSVNVAELQKSLDADARELRSLNLKIQELNWLTDLE